MMRWVFYGLGLTMLAIAVVWSNVVSNQTREALREVNALRKDIRQEREVISVLEAEWAWLNRPSRLERLVAENADALALVAMMPETFAELAEVAMPPVDDGMDPVALIDLDEAGPESMVKRAADQPVQVTGLKP